MAGSYDGSIRIDTAINAAPIDNGLAQIENKIKGLAATIGLAFGVKELIDFGKRSIDAASDLAEAQNVVDTAFGAMSWKMEQFAATALETYGISELTAKNMGSTYMAMAKGMGVATDAASDMAVTLTGRLSDIMSFYNKTQSEVDTIGRALITGETEPLKAIGVVMTQTNLSAYAMAQGFAKYIAEKRAQLQPLFPTPSSYAPQLPVGKDGKLDISISLDVENAQANNVKADTVLRGTDFLGNVKVDPWMSNMKGR